MHACQELISILETVAIGRDSGHCEKDAQGSHYTAVLRPTADKRLG